MSSKFCQLLSNFRVLEFEQRDNKEKIQSTINDIVSLFLKYEDYFTDVEKLIKVLVMNIKSNLQFDILVTSTNIYSYFFCLEEKNQQYNFHLNKDSNFFKLLKNEKLVSFVKEIEILFNVFINTKSELINVFNLSKKDDISVNYGMTFKVKKDIENSFKLDFFVFHTFNKYRIDMKKFIYENSKNYFIDLGAQNQEKFIYELNKWY
ncbi:hypothetical protein BCF59_0547 [Mycoplasmopsis mustelae]|uniref:Uncharacterized protein n=1 Tax=Mycoplasmopsis mustelae TaxID=171289 RepID=A0A4R7UCA5_9BACT|nr:hypothetical protein [Mycoplasmopsis mustelae]TDV23556.1 hypothetical protein BCF59_0547 [Mycoplasmopsis mustelae]